MHMNGIGLVWKHIRMWHIGFMKPSLIDLHRNKIYMYVSSIFMHMNGIAIVWKLIRVWACRFLEACKVVTKETFYSLSSEGTINPYNHHFFDA